MLSKTLEMVFQNASGKNVTIRLPEPKDGLTEAEVKTAMQSIITGNYFQTNGGDLQAIVSARITSRDSSELVVK